eukprot:1807982-Alexandrium_andersonii.AAC.1
MARKAPPRPPARRRQAAGRRPRIALARRPRKRHHRAPARRRWPPGPPGPRSRGPAEGRRPRQSP